MKMIKLSNLKQGDRFSWRGGRYIVNNCEGELVGALCVDDGLMGSIHRDSMVGVGRGRKVNWFAVVVGCWGLGVSWGLGCCCWW